jgi:Tfp pilus assembly protein PilF
MTYLRLLVLPFNQTLEYDYRIHDSLLTFPVALSVLCIAVLLGVSACFLLASRRFPARKRTLHPAFRLAGFGILWFFITLSVESGIIPIANVIFEHRVYLPSVGILSALAAPVAMVPEGRLTLKRTAAVLLTLIVILMTTAAHARNRMWASEISLWQDNVEKAPMRVKALYGLGLVYKKAGRYQDAARMLKLASLLGSDYPFIFYELGQCYEKSGWLQDAANAYMTALGMNPRYVRAHISLGDIYFTLGETEKALQEYRAALIINPFDEGARDAVSRISGLTGKSAQ